MTYIHLGYDVPNSNWWTPNHTTPHSVDHLLASILESSHKIEQERIQGDNNKDELLAEMDGYLRSLYLLESLVGEGILENEATLDTVEALLLLPSADSKLAKKVQNLHAAAMFLFPLSFMSPHNNKSHEFTLELALTLHRIVGKDLIPNAGCFRQNWASPSQETYVYLEPHFIESHLNTLFTETAEALCKSNNSLLTQVKIAASFMTSFLHIHPFSNGNGRVARLLMPLLLCKHSVVPIHVAGTRIGRNTLLQCLRESRHSWPFKPEALARLLLEKALIKNVYGATTTDTSMIEEKMWLLAYVSSVIESDSNEPHNIDLVQPTMDALKHVHSVFPNLTPDIDLKNDFKALLDTVKYPVVAAGLLFWISNYIADPLFYNQNSLISGTERMLIFELLNEIAIIYPLQRAYALEILGEAIVRDYDKLSPLVAIEVKKKFLDQVIFLLKLGFVMPVLDFVLENSSKMDDALVVYFLKRVYELTSYPYHRDIMRLVAAIVGRIQADNLGANGNVVQLLLESFLISLGGDAAAKAAAAKEAENDFFADVNMDAVDAEAEAEDEALRLAIAAQLARKGK
ncbi:beta ketoadipyl CoA thiolase, th1 [Chytriomyces hyalinus]|nr:beta ketoadipyl CoA thiolase, th1 [Chytriomyces hyalinus]